MTYLFPGIRPPTKLASGVPDGTTRRALASVEVWAAEVSERLSRVTATQVSGLVVPLAESDVTGLVADLASRPTGSGTGGRSTRWTGAAALGTGAFVDDGTSVSLAGGLTLSTFTAGSVLFAGVGGLVSQDNAHLFWDDANNRLGVGTNAPSVDLQVVGAIASTGASDGLYVGATSRTRTDAVTGFTSTNVEFTKDAPNTFIVSTYSNVATDVASAQVFRARGTAAASAAVQSGDSLGTFAFTGATSATAHHSGAYLVATATETWVTGSNVGTKLEFLTSRNATVPASARAVRMTIDHDGAVTIANTLALTPMTTGSILFAGASGVITQSNAKLFWDNTNNMFLLGATSRTKAGLAGLAEFTKDAAAAVSVLSTYGTGVSSNLVLFRGQGTAASSSAVLSGDVLGSLSFSGSPSATGTFGSANISGSATENWSGTAGGSKITFNTCLNTTTTRSIKLTVENDGGISLGNSSAAAVSAASQVTLRANTQLQVSENGGAYTTVVKGTGTANRITKWSNTTGLLADSLVSDDGTTFAINTNKFTVTEANGNTSVAGTLGVTGLSTLTGGFTLGADSSANTHKITNLTNGSSGQDAVAFNQLATAINAAVSGTANTLAKFTSTNVVGNSSITDNGTIVTVSSALSVTGNVLLGSVAGNTVDVAADLTRFGTSTVDGVYINNNQLNWGHLEDADAIGYINFSGYNLGTSRFRSLVIADGKNSTIATFTGSSKAVTFEGDVTTKGTTTLCDGTGDTLKFYGGTGATQQTITGSRGGNAALADLLTKLATLGLIVDSTSA